MKILNNTLYLDDGQVIPPVKMSELSHFQIISIANQLRREKEITTADLLMGYQHRRFGGQK